MDYTDLYNFQTKDGIVVPNQDDVLAGMQKKFAEIFGAELDLSPETPVGRLIEADYVLVQTALGVTAQTANQFNIDESTGRYLDSIGRLFNLERTAATRSRIAIRCYFSDAATDAIPAGSMVSSSTSGQAFLVDALIENTGQTDDEQRYYADGYATAVDEGPVLAPPGTVTTVQSSVIGWIGVTNTAQVYVGSAIETDASFRRRIKASRAIGVGFFDSMTSRLNRLSGVYSNCILENKTDLPSIQREVLLPPHSVFVAVDCVATEDLYQDIAKVISTTKPAGTAMAKDNISGGTLVERPVYYGAGRMYKQDVSFFKAESRRVFVSISYLLGNYTGSDLAYDVGEAVKDFMATMPVGATLYSASLSTYLMNRLGLFIAEILLQREGDGEIADTTVEMAGYEVPYVDDSSIRITSFS